MLAWKYSAYDLCKITFDPLCGIDFHYRDQSNSLRSDQSLTMPRWRCGKMPCVTSTSGCSSQSERAGCSGARFVIELCPSDSPAQSDEKLSQCAVDVMAAPLPSGFSYSSKGRRTVANGRVGIPIKSQEPHLRLMTAAIALSIIRARVSMLLTRNHTGFLPDALRKGSMLKWLMRVHA